jgi:hypothetical protein
VVTDGWSSHGVAWVLAVGGGGVGELTGVRTLGASLGGAAPAGPAFGGVAFGVAAFGVAAFGVAAFGVAAFGVAAFGAAGFWIVGCSAGERGAARVDAAAGELRERCDSHQRAPT